MMNRIFKGVIVILIYLVTLLATVSIVQAGIWYEAQKISGSYGVDVYRFYDKRYRNLCYFAEGSGAGSQHAINCIKESKEK